MASAVVRFCPSSTRLAEFSILMIMYQKYFKAKTFSQIDVKYFQGWPAYMGALGDSLERRSVIGGKRALGRR